MIISGCTERLALIERKMLDCVISKDESKMNSYRERLIDLMTFCFIPAFKYYAESFFTVYSSSSADMDYFFRSRIVGFLELIISSVTIANDELIYPDRATTTGLDRLAVEELFRIARRHIGFFDFRKRWDLWKLRKLFEPLIKKFPPILPGKMPIATRREALQAALISKIETMDGKSLESMRDFVGSLNVISQKT